MLGCKGAEDAVIAFLQLFPIPHDIAAIVRFVRHHDDDRVAGHLLKSIADRPAESVLAGVLNRAQLLNPLRQFLKNCKGLIRTAIIDDDDFMLDLIQPQFQMQMFNC